MAELGGLRTAIASLADKVQTLRAAIDALQEGTVVQDAIDELQSAVDDIGTSIDEAIADAQGATATPAPAEGTTPPA